MAIKIPKTNKDYILMVNRAELYDRAVELGYEAVVYPNQSELEENDVSLIKSQGKFLVCVYYSDEMSVDKRLEQWRSKLEDVGIRRRTFNFIDMFEEDDDNYLPLAALAKKYFEPVENMERYLEREGYIPTSDYTRRCGNCHEYLPGNANYCIYCGTKRGDGEFLPYYNLNDILYGSPTKIKKHCQRCGKSWIAYEFNNGENYKFCPYCGEASPTLEELRDTDFVCSYFSTGEASYENKKRPKLLTEEQVKKILSERRDGFNPVYNRHDMKLLVDTIGLNLKADASEYGEALEEQEADTLNQIREVYRVEGEDYISYPEVKCPHCGSRLISGLQFRDGKEWTYPKTDAMNPLRNPCHTGVCKEKDAPDPKYLCLCCSEEF